MEKYLLHINEPCTENWESMTTAEQGKFCNHCNKTVFDFTSATDTEIVKHIEKMKGEMFCGRFEENQLDRWIERSDIKTSNPRLYKFLISFMLLGAAQGANAQAPSAQEKVTIQKKLDSLLNHQNLIANKEIMSCDTVVVNSIPNIRIGKVVPYSTTASPLIVVNGKRLKFDIMNKLNPDMIKNIEVISAPKSIALYGIVGSNGAIIITSKYTKKELRKLM